MKHPSRGFTLLELIVVLAIFGVFAAMAYGGLNYVLNARRELETRLDRTAEWQKAFQRLRNDFQTASTRGARNGYGQYGDALLFDRNQPTVEFTRAGWRNPLSLPRPSLERIVYRFDDEKHELRRETWRVLDRVDDREPVSVVVLSAIDEAQWRFWDGKQWLDRWPAQAGITSLTQSPPPPQGVELTLKSKDYNEVRWLFRIAARPSP